MSTRQAGTDELLIDPESVERKLLLHRRMAVAAHRLMCPFCSRYRKQLCFMEKAVAVERESPRPGSTPPRIEVDR